MDMTMDKEKEITFEKFPHPIGVTLFKAWKNYLGKKSNDLLGFGVLDVNGAKVLVVNQKNDVDLVYLLHKFQDTFPNCQWQIAQ